MKIRDLFFVVLIATSLNTFSQQFRGGVSGGLNFAQIDGINRNTYGKLGLNAGAFISREILPDRMSWQLELNYSSKGNYYIEKVLTPSGPEITAINNMDLKYVELPLLLQYFINQRMRLGGGLAPDVLIKEDYYNEEGAVSSEYASDLNRFGVNGILEFNYFVTKKFGLGIRFSHSLIPIYKFPAYTNWYFRSGYFNDVLRFNLTYYIS